MILCFPALSKFDSWIGSVDKSHYVSRVCVCVWGGGTGVLEFGTQVSIKFKDHSNNWCIHSKECVNITIPLH